MLNFILPVLKNPLTRMIGSKVIDGINHKMEKDKIIRAKEIEAVKTVSVEQVRQQEHSIKDEILTLLISAIFIFTFLPFSQPYMMKGFEILKSAPTFPVIKLPSGFKGPLPERNSKFPTCAVFTKFATGVAGLGSKIPMLSSLASGLKSDLTSTFLFCACGEPQDTRDSPKLKTSK